MIRVAYITVGEGGSDVAITAFWNLALHKDIHPIVIINKTASRYGLKTDLIKKNIEYIYINYDFDTWPSLKGSAKKYFLFPYYLYKRIVINQLAINKLTRILKNRQIDIIHSNSSVFSWGFMVAKRLQIPHVWHLREYLNTDIIPLYSWQQRLKMIHSKNNYNIAISHGIFDHFQLNKKNSKIVYDGIINEEKIKITSEKKNKYFLFVGRVVKEKGVFELVNAFIKFTKLGFDYDLYLAGIYTQIIYDQILTIAKKENIVNKIFFLGQRKDIEELMSTAAALIVPSKLEALGLTVIEAMKNNCLVIGHNIMGIKEQFDNGLKFTGKEIALRFNNQEELIELMKQIAENEISTYYPMLKRANQTVFNFYTAQKNVDQIISIYKELLK